MSERFKDRISSYPNRHMITVLSQSSTEMIVDIIKDNTGVTQTGTPINADVFNDWDDSVNTALSNSSEAKEKATTALNRAGNAETNASAALTKAEEAISKANSAIDSVAGSGTRLIIGGEAKETYEFVSDPQVQLNNKLNKSELLNLVHPVGAIYLTINSTNPGTLFGGTWVAWGQGRMIAGYNSSDSDFYPVEHTYGSKSYQKHNHCVTINGTSSLNGNLTYKTYSSATSCSGTPFSETWSDSGVTPSGTSKDKNVTVAVNMNHTHTGTIDEHGVGTCGNLPPYIVCYMWKRTA